MSRPGPRVTIVAAAPAAPIEPAGFGTGESGDSGATFPAPFPLDPAPTP